MNDRQDLIDVFLFEVNKIVDSQIDIVIENAEINPDQLEDLSSEVKNEVIILYNQLVDDLSNDIIDDVNTALNEDSSVTGYTEDQLNLDKLVGSYYILETLRQTFHGIHNSKIARQIIENVVKEQPSGSSPEEIDTAIINAQDAAIAKSVQNGKDSLERITVGELGFTYFLLTRAIHLSRGIKYYLWVTMGDSHVRATHAMREGDVRQWDDGDIHPAEEYGCRCNALALSIEEAENLLNASSNLGEKPMTTFKSRTRVKSKDVQSKKPMHFEVKAKGVSGNAELRIFGEIGDDGWYDGGTDNTFTSMVNNIDALNLGSKDTLEVLITSQGGSMTVGNALYEYLSSHPATVATNVLGEASSAAFTIAMAGDIRRYSAASYSLVHNPWSCVCGNHKDASQAAEQLKAAAETMINVYASVSGQDEDFIKELMDNETIVDAKKALEYGFATEIIESAGVLDASRVDATRAYIAEQKACFTGAIESKREESIMPKATGVKKEVDAPLKDQVEEVIAEMAADGAAKKKDDLEVELQASNDILQETIKGLKSDLKAANERIQELETSQDDFEDRVTTRETEIRDEIVQDMAQASDFRKKADACGFSPEGSTAKDVMLSVLSQAGVADHEKLQGDSLRNVFDFALKSKGNSDVDETFEKEDKSVIKDTSKSDTYAATRNTKSK